MENITIIGSGTMGHSIALSLAWGGLSAKVYCINNKAAKDAEQEVKKKLKTMTAHQVITDIDEESIFKYIQFTTNLEDALSGTSFIIEAITENLNLKRKLFDDISGYLNEDTVLASNTSGFLPSELSQNYKYPEQFAVAHFWNPAHLIPLVEIVHSVKTSEKTVQRIKILLEKINKKPIVLKKEITGFIGNRLQYAMFREAQYLLDNGYADKEDIDASVTHSIGRRYPVTGPLMTADMGGLDVFSAISDYLFKELSSQEQSGETISNLVNQGKFGIKNGEGFYEWNQEFSERVNRERDRVLLNFLEQDKTGD